MKVHLRTAMRTHMNNVKLFHSSIIKKVNIFTPHFYANFFSLFLIGSLKNCCDFIGHHIYVTAKFLRYIFTSPHHIFTSHFYATLPPGVIFIPTRVLLLVDHLLIFEGFIQKLSRFHWSSHLRYRQIFTPRFTFLCTFYARSRAFTVMYRCSTLTGCSLHVIETRSSKTKKINTVHFVI